MSWLARIWIILLIGGVVGIFVGVVGIWNRVVEPEATTVTWAQFMAKEPDKNWLRIEDAPIVDVRTVRMVRQKKLRTVETAYIPAVVDPSDPGGPVRVFAHVHDDVDTVAPRVPAGTPPVVRRGLLEGRRIHLDDATREFLNRQGAPVAPDMICMNAGPASPIWVGAAALGCGVLLLVLGLKARTHRKRMEAAEPAG